ncbi:MAG: methylenetetrahydrofolate reductase [Ahrensia sp.]|nr:methylenetetrahydrofolate reductase [Ahrensia sp.]
MSAQLVPGSATISLEFFPPKGVSAHRALMTGAYALKRFAPAYQTVTFGADGSAIEGTLDIATKLQALNDIPTASHLTLCQFDRAGLLDYADRLWEFGIERLVLLRGDVESGTGLSDVESVAEAVRLLKKRHPFDISVSAYPEVHPKAQSAEADMQVLLGKQAAGANRAITQFFFDNADFYRFRDRAGRAGLRIPLVPGIIPIANFERIKGFAAKCGAKVPKSFDAFYAKAGDDRARQTDVSRKIVEDQVADLARNGVDAIHIYTLNRTDLTADAIRAFEAQFDGLAAKPKLALAG